MSFITNPNNDGDSVDLSGLVPKTRTINKKPLDNDVVLDLVDFPNVKQRIDDVENKIVEMPTIPPVAGCEISVPSIGFSPDYDTGSIEINSGSRKLIYKFGYINPMTTTEKAFLFEEPFPNACLHMDVRSNNGGGCILRYSTVNKFNARLLTGSSSGRYWAVGY